eukprot:7502881-Pyramimonas_sp.AAC.1
MRMCCAYGLQLSYIKVLPSSTGSLLEWTDEERATLLAGSPIATVAEDLHAQVDSAVTLLLEVAPKGSLSEDRLRWAFSILFSRLVRPVDMHVLC